MGQLMDDIISAAENCTENCKDIFDYSVENLAAVDDLLNNVRNDMLDENTLYNIITNVGSYVFETARRNYGGEYYWLLDEQQPILVAGEPDFSVSIRAWQKVKGFLKNGAEDSLPFYVQGYKEHIEKGKVQKGYKATII